MTRRSEQPVTLKNGSKEFRSAVLTTVTSLRKLFESGVPGVLAIYELMLYCRTGKKVRVSESSLDLLIKDGLLDGEGKIHEVTRNVVLSSVQGHGLDIQIGSPFAE